MNCVISCALQGAELGALEGANKAGIETRGLAPYDLQSHWNNWDPVETFGLTKAKHSDHDYCLKKNLEKADAVLWVGNRNRAQQIQTLCKESKVPFIMFGYHWLTAGSFRTVKKTRLLVDWLKDNRVETLLVTGDLEANNSGVQGFTERLIINAVGELRHPGSLKRKSSLARDISEAVKDDILRRREKLARKEREFKILIEGKKRVRLKRTRLTAKAKRYK